MERHVSAVHHKAYLYVCKNCGASFKRQDVWKKHTDACVPVQLHENTGIIPGNIGMPPEITGMPPGNTGIIPGNTGMP